MLSRPANPELRKQLEEGDNWDRVIHYTNEHEAIQQVKLLKSLGTHREYKLMAKAKVVPFDELNDDIVF